MFWVTYIHLITFGRCSKASYQVAINILVTTWEYKSHNTDKHHYLGIAPGIDSAMNDNVSNQRLKQRDENNIYINHLLLNFVKDSITAKRAEHVLKLCTPWILLPDNFPMVIQDALLVNWHMWSNNNNL